MRCVVSVLGLCVLFIGCGRLGFGTEAELGSQDGATQDAETADAGLDATSPAVDAGEDDGGAACVPATEVCNGVDDDCDGDTDEDSGTPLCGAGEACASGVCTGAMAYGWDRTYGGTGVNDVRAVTTDVDGNIFAVGSFRGSVNFGDGPRIASVDDIFVLSLASDGSFRWVETLGGVGNQTATGVAVDSSGNICVVGSASGATDFGGGPQSLTAGTAFVLGLSPEGGYRWDKMYIVNGRIAPQPSVDTTSAGDVMITVDLDARVDFGGGSRSVAGSDVAILKLASDGSYLWDTVIGGPSTETVGGIAVGSGDSVTVAGSFEDSVDFGGGVRTARSDAAPAFVLRLNRDGAYIWDTTMVGVPLGDASVYSVALDTAGNVYVAGWSSGPVDFGGGLRPNPAWGDGFVWSLDTDGTYRWDRTFPGEETVRVFDVTTHSTGEVTVGGEFHVAADFGGGRREVTGREAGFLLGLDSTGAYLWDYVAIGSGNWNVRTLAAGRAGCVVAAGWFSDTIEFGGGEHVSAGAFAGFVLSLEPAR